MKVIPAAAGIVRATAHEAIKMKKGILPLIPSKFARAENGVMIPVSLTQYCVQGETRRGRQTRHGIVAADPRIFPLARYVEVFLGNEYLGRYLVDDTGGNVLGATLDIWNPDCREAARFGRHWGNAILVAREVEQPVLAVPVVVPARMIDDRVQTDPLDRNAAHDGGADLLLVETIFDTLNAKAAFFAIATLFAERDIELPLMASVTFIQPGSNRGVTGQTVEAFWNSISHVPLLSVGMNCALGPKEMRPLIEELSRIAPIYISSHPNAGLPDPLLPTGFPETPQSLAPQLREWAENGWLNIVGGCCGTTPAHIKSIAEAVHGLPPRVPPVAEPYLRLSGLESVTIRPESNFVNIGERTNVTGSPVFSKLILAGDYDKALNGVVPTLVGLRSRPPSTGTSARG